MTTWADLNRPGDATDFFARSEFPPFDPGTGGYCRDHARWLMELSRLVYRHDTEEDDPPPQPTRTHFLAQAGLRQRRFFMSSATDTQAMLVEPIGAPSYAVLAFRGTEQKLKDFLTDLDMGVPPLDDSTVDVHEGFREALDSVWHDIADELGKLACPVFYTGHSLGAALATLAASRRPPRALYTFGSPLVGNAAFAASLGSQPVYRVVDGSDIVATVPPPALGYCHVGTEHKLVAPPAPATFLGRFKSLLCSPPPFLADHAPINYVDRL